MLKEYTYELSRDTSFIHTIDLWFYLFSLMISLFCTNNRIMLKHFDNDCCFWMDYVISRSVVTTFIQVKFIFFKFIYAFVNWLHCQVINCWCRSSLRSSHSSNEALHGFLQLLMTFHSLLLIRVGCTDWLLSLSLAFVHCILFGKMAINWILSRFVTT